VTERMPRAVTREDIAAYMVKHGMWKIVDEVKVCPKQVITEV